MVVFFDSHKRPPRGILPLNHILGEITPGLPIHFPVYHTEINPGLEIALWENFELKSTVGKFDLTS